MAASFCTFRIRSKLKLNLLSAQPGMQNFRPASSTTGAISSAKVTESHSRGGITFNSTAQDGITASPMARLSTSSLIRSLLLSAFFTSPLLFRPAFAIFRHIANSQSNWFHPDRNILLRWCIYPLVYRQFCAGRNKREIKQTSSEIRQLGFSGIVLCYGKEVQVEDGQNLIGYSRSSQATLEAEVQEWATGNLKTLDMISEGDWLGIKFTGAGPSLTEILMRGEAAPQIFLDSMAQICDQASAKGKRIWIDAEQQILQKTIDRWAFDLMRQYNRPGVRAVVYNTIQAYLKDSRGKLEHQLKLSQNQGWRLGVKLVRGAYISNDDRGKIHNTKAETDDSYDGIVADVLCGKFPGLVGRREADLDLLLAGHNSESIQKASRLARDLAAQSRLDVVPEFAQLQGMADDVGCELLQAADNADKHSNLSGGVAFKPKVFKCLTWGSIQECMQYLTRRLVENRGAADRMKAGASEMRKELYRRLLGRRV